jgi:hypothetical protein
MSEFSIEKNSENIYNIKTKEYFKEVYSSYTSDNFRSAVVMLYSVVVCDLIYKLQELKDRHKDTAAEKILNDIITIKAKNEKSSDWETKLIEFIKDRTSLFENADYANIQSLQQHRHLSAHPVLDQIDLLFSPNKETVRAHIRNMLEGVLTKPPVFSKRIIEELVLDLSLNKDIFLGNGGDLKKYLEAKYFKNLSKGVENAIFKALWKFIFTMAEDENCKINRRINFEALKIIFNRRKGEYLTLIESESIYFSNIARGKPMLFLIVFLSNNREVYSFLNHEAVELIKGGVKDDDTQHLLSWFVEDNILEHIRKIKEHVDVNRNFEVDERVFNAFVDIGIELGCEKEVLELGIYLFKKSLNYSDADNKFGKYIQPYLNKYDKQHFTDLFEAIESNSQINGRNKMIADSDIIKQYSDKILGKKFDYNQYPEFYANYLIFEERTKIK